MDQHRAQQLPMHIDDLCSLRVPGRGVGAHATHLQVGEALFPDMDQHQAQQILGSRSSQVWIRDDRQVTSGPVKRQLLEHFANELEDVFDAGPESQTKK